MMESNLVREVGQHIWQSTLFALLALVALRLMAKAEARLRLTVYWIAMLKFILPAAAVTAVVEWAGLDSTSLQNLPAVPLIAMVAQPEIEETVMVRAVSSTKLLLIVLGGVWATGVILSLSIWLTRHMRHKSGIKAQRVLEYGAEAEAFKEAERRLGVRSRVALIEADGIDEPAVVGLVAQRVVMPAWLSSRLSYEEMVAVLGHELAHVHRRDNLSGLLQTVIKALFWFHPLVWSLDAGIRLEREHACDERVVRGGSNPETYASGILKICKYSVGWQQCAAASYVTGTDLQRRIRNIMSDHKNAGVFERALIAGTALIFIVMVAGAGLKPIKANSFIGLIQRDQNQAQNPEKFTLNYINLNDSPLVFERVELINNSDLNNRLAARYTLKNTSGKAIKSFYMALINGDEFKYTPAAIPVGEKHTGEFEFLSTGKAPFLALIPQVKFEDGSVWRSKHRKPGIYLASSAVSEAPPAPPAPPAPEARPSAPPAPSAPSAGLVEESPLVERRSEGELRRSTLERAIPAYPEEAKAQGVEGDVSIEILIDEEGRVVEARPVSGPEMLHAVCQEAAQKWRFQPTLVDGKPVKVKGRLTFRFVID